MLEVISSIRSLRAGSQVFALLMFFLCDFAYYVVGKSLQLLCILPFGILCFSAIRMMLVKIILAMYMLAGIVVYAKVDTVPSVNCVQSAFL